MASQAEMMRNRGYITAQEVFKRTGIPVAQVYKLLKDGRLTGIDIASRHYVLYTSLVEYIGVEAARVIGLTA